MGQAKVRVRPGGGLVARFMDSIVVVAGDDDPAKAEALVDAVETSSWEGADAGPATASRLAGLLAEGDLPAFALVAPAGDQLVVLVHGAAEAEIVNADGAQTLEGGRSVTWSDRLVDQPLRRLDLRLAGVGVQPDPRSDLRAGLLSGDGALVEVVEDRGPEPPTPSPLSWTESPTAARAGANSTYDWEDDGEWEEPGSGGPVTAAPPEPAAVPPEVVSRARETAPPGSTTAPPASTAPSGPGASNGHVPAPSTPVEANGATELAPVHPAAPAGAPSAKATVMRSLPIGALVADDGSRILLDRSYVLGREPSIDRLCQDGDASPIIVDDPDNLISRVQVRITVGADDVEVADADSANGSFVAQPGAPGWTKLGLEPTPLPIGWSLRIGKRVFTHVGPGT